MSAYGSASFGCAGIPVVVTGARCLDMSSVYLDLDSDSAPGLRNPARRDSIFCWRNWTLVPGANARSRLVRSISWLETDCRLRICFDGALSNSSTYQLCSEIVGTNVVFSTPGIHRSATIRRAQEQIIQDWAKPERESDLQGGSLGTTQIVSGDLALTSGVASLHERIVRRVQTATGEFVHDTTYGTDWREKGLLRIDGLQRLQSRLVAQIKREPDVVRCEVALGQVIDSPGTLSVHIKADTADGPLVVSTEVGRP